MSLGESKRAGFLLQPWQTLRNRAHCRFHHTRYHEASRCSQQTLTTWPPFPEARLCQYTRGKDLNRRSQSWRAELKCRWITRTRGRDFLSCNEGVECVNQKPENKLKGWDSENKDPGVMFTNVLLVTKFLESWRFQRLWSSWIRIIDKKNSHKAS